MIITYIFWHAPLPGGDVGAYETALAAFHASLGRHAPRGLIASAAYGVAGAPWVPPGPAYADWYLLDGWAALGALNEAAVAPPLDRPHAAVAALAGWGAGGVMRLDAGAPGPDRGGERLWLTKPPDVTYADFGAAMAPLLAQGSAALWRRQLVLGPMPEFALLGQTAGRVPAAWIAARTRERAVWPA